jgi:hypothetical protein
MEGHGDISFAALYYFYTYHGKGGQKEVVSIQSPAHIISLGSEKCYVKISAGASKGVVLLVSAKHLLYEGSVTEHRKQFDFDGIVQLEDQRGPNQPPHSHRRGDRLWVVETMNRELSGPDFVTVLNLDRSFVGTIPLQSVLWRADRRSKAGRPAEVMTILGAKPYNTNDKHPDMKPPKAVIIQGISGMADVRFTLLSSKEFRMNYRDYENAARLLALLHRRAIMWSSTSPSQSSGLVHGDSQENSGFGFLGVSSFFCCLAPSSPPIVLGPHDEQKCKC